MKDLRYAEVVWHDAHGGDDGWIASDEIRGDPARIVSVGQVLSSNRRGSR